MGAGVDAGVSARSCAGGVDMAGLGTADFGMVRDSASITFEAGEEPTMTVLLCSAGGAAAGVACSSRQPRATTKLS